MAGPKVEVKITARDDTRAALRSVKQGLGSITTQLASLKTSAIAFGAAFAAVRFAVLPLVNLGRAAVNAADDLLALSERTGISVEKLSLFAHAAKAANTDIETVGNAARLLSVRMLEAARGSKQATALMGAFGVTAADSLEGALEKVLTQLGELPKGWQKSALAVKLFGRSGAALIPFANSLKEGVDQARRFNVGISEETAKAADAFNESLAAIKASLSASFVTALTPVLNDLTRTLNDPKVQAGLRNLAAAAAGAATAIITNFDAIKTAFVALAAVAVSMLAGRVVGAIGAWITASRAAVVAANAQRGVTLAGLQATLQAAAAEQARAAALLRSAQAAAANAVASARMNVVLNSVLPAQKAARIADTAHTAAQIGLAGAMTATARAGGVVRAAIAFLGGPIGAITTALSLGAAAWAIWGNRAEAAGRKTSAVLEKAQQQIDQFKESQKLAAAGGSEIVASLTDLERDAGRLQNKLTVLRRFQAQVQEESQGRFKNTKIETDVKDTLADIEAVRKATADLKKLKAEGAEPGLDPDALLAKLAKPDKPAKAAAGVANDAKQSIESAIALTQDALDREQRLLDAQLEDQLISLKDFYARKTALAQAGIDAEIAAKREELTLAKDQGDVARLTSEITLLERKRGDVAVESRREQIDAEKTLHDEVEKTRGQLAELQGRPIEATEINITLDQRDLRQKLEAQINDPSNPVELRARLRIDLANLDEIKRLTIAQGGLSDLERQITNISTLGGERERTLELNIEGGLETELSGREKIVKVHQDTAAALEALLPKYIALNTAIGTPEALNNIEALKNKILELKQPLNVLQREIVNTLKSGLGSFFSDLISGAQSVGDAFKSLEKTLLNAFSNIAAQHLAESLFAGLGSGGGAKGAGWIAQAMAAFGFHTGGIVGQGGALRMVNPLVFAAAPRLHSGGTLGLKSDEVPAILQRGEEVLTRGDPRHARNTGGATVNMTVVTQDANSFRRSEGQITADMRLAMDRARRNL